MVIRFRVTNTPFFISAGASHNCLLSYSNTVKCWGANALGQLGQGHTSSIGDDEGEMERILPVNLGSGLIAKTLATGLSHSCALLDNNSVKCWGDNQFGQLGQGRTLNPVGTVANQMGDNLPAINLGTGRTVKMIQAGNNHSCALLDNDTVKCWGANQFGQLGQGDRISRGTVVNQMGDELDAVNLGTGRTAKSLGLGDNHACALLDNDTVKCWGANQFGQLGQGRTLNPVGTVATQMGDALPAVNLGTGHTVKMIQAGNNHSCALLDNNTVKCWGDNQFGQLGQGRTLNPVGTVATQMGDALPAVELGTGRTGKTVILGTNFTCALLDNNTVKCWGDNQFGQLGQGDRTNRGTVANQMGDELDALKLGTGYTVQAIEVGATHTCVLLNDLDDDDIKCWGGNSDGQLGLGDTDNRGDDSGEMGDMLLVVGVELGGGLLNN